ncbi:MAG: efflux transporter outer membrane subunit [Magnetospirillum sp.]|nr:efflux transporter outer membrane subunit [Magnetospirillum sp.]
MKSLGPVAPVILAGVLASCSLAPEYHPPEMPVPAAYSEAGIWRKGQPADEIPKGTWWKVFGDPRLNALEDKVSSGNQDLKVALARFDQARAAAQYARADYYPQVSAQEASFRQRRSGTVANVFPPRIYSDHYLSADVSYELDVWGRVRNLVAAGEDRAQASGADLATVDLAVHAELAADYFALRGDDARQDILGKTVVAYGKAFDLIRQRHDGGIAAAADVAQAQTQLETAKTQASDTRLKRAQLEHAIAILIGEAPADFHLAPVPLNGLPPAINPGLPSTLLERRPDIAAAERRVAAANADIGVARAAFYPVIDLRALVGAESASAATWFQAPSSLWALGPTAVLTVFDGGRLSALSAEAHAAYDETVASYRQTVLTAWLDVEDNLAALRLLEQEAGTQDAAVTAANTALQQAELRYAGGLVTYLEVVSTQNAALAAELGAEDILTRRMTAGVLLIKALGGGWPS